VAATVQPLPTVAKTGVEERRMIGTDTVNVRASAQFILILFSTIALCQC
jgi:hypothetical protein